MPILASFILPHPPLLIPEIGKGKEEIIEKTAEAYDKVATEIAALKPDTILFITPHAECYRDYFQIADGEVEMGSFGAYKANQVSFRLFYDRPLVGMIGSIAKGHGFPAGTEGGEELYLDHGTMVPLYFINKRYRDFKAVRVSTSGLSLSDHYRFGQIIQEAVDRLGRKVVVVASGNLSHALRDNPNDQNAPGPRYDKKVIKILQKANFGELLSFKKEELRKAEECGHRCFCLLSGILDRLALAPKLLSYESVTGVGYLLMSYKPMGEDPSRAYLELYRTKRALEVQEERKNMDPYARLAYLAIERFVRSGKTLPLSLDVWPENFYSKRGAVFVTLKKDGEIRGCLGSIRPLKKNLGTEIIANAIAAASSDARFPRLRDEELPLVSISVDVVTSLIPVLSTADLDPKTYGVLVEFGERRAAVLPNLPDVDDVEKQLLIALYKAGIDQGDDFQMARFKVAHHV